MSPGERERLEAGYRAALASITREYEQVDRLAWALNRMLAQLGLLARLHDETRAELFDLVRRQKAVREGKLPFELPYQVTPDDYARALTLLVALLDHDLSRMGEIQAAVIAVAVAARATDAESAATPANIEAAILAAVEDSQRARGRRDALSEWPGDGALAERLAQGEAVAAGTLGSPEYRAWARARPGADPVGTALAVVDQVTRMDLAGAYRAGREILDAGEADAGRILELAARLAPGGSAIGKLIETALSVRDTALSVRDAALSVRDAGTHPREAAATAGRAGIVRVETFARGRMRYFAEAGEQRIRDRLRATDLYRRAVRVEQAYDWISR